MDLARQFPDSMRLDGIDIDLTQCPPREWLPPNVTLRQWDVFSEVPEDLYESYDIVCVRHLNLTSRENDPTDILKNLLKLLSKSSDRLVRMFKGRASSRDNIANHVFYKNMLIYL